MFVGRIQEEARGQSQLTWQGTDHPHEVGTEKHSPIQAGPQTVGRLALKAPSRPVYTIRVHSLQQDKEKNDYLMTSVRIVKVGCQLSENSADNLESEL